MKLIKRRRSNFLLTLISTIFFWLVWFLILFFTSPVDKLIAPLFFLMFFLALNSALSIILANRRRGVLIALGVVLALVLQWQRLAHFLNLILLAAALLCFEVYFTKKK